VNKTTTINAAYGH